MVRVAIPVFGGRISNRLDCSERFVLATVDAGRVASRESIRWVRTGPTSLITLLIDMGVDVLICNGITGFISRRLARTGIRVIPWVSGDADTVLDRFARGQLPGDDTSSETENTAGWDAGGNGRHHS